MPRLIFPIIFLLAIIIGFEFLVERKSQPNPEKNIVPIKQITNQTGTTPETLAPLPTETLAWQTYTNSDFDFSLRYPPTWFYKLNDNDSQTIYFSPPKPALFEIESEPRIILQIMSLVNVRGAHSTIADWFLNEVEKNPERFDKKQDILNGDILYSFSEGAGEYPHEQFLLIREDYVYWFSIEASDQLIHEMLPLLVQSIRFAD